MQEVPHASRETVEAVDGVHLTQLAVGERMSVQHYHFEPGAVVPAHSHPHEQVGYVARGTLTFAIGAGATELEDGTDSDGDHDEFVVGPGDSYSIPGGESHAVRNDSEEPVSGIDVFSPPRTDPDWRD